MLTPSVGARTGSYESFYGLFQAPFGELPDGESAYESRSYKEALEQVATALRSREAITVIFGECGSGQTMLCRALRHRLEPRTFASVIDDPSIGLTAILARVLGDFGLIDPGRAAPAGADDLTRTLRLFLASLVPLRAKAVIVVDAAHHLEMEVAEQLALLSDFEALGSKPVQLVLVGGPGLQELLDRPNAGPLRQRVQRQFHLGPLEADEIQPYIDARIRTSRAAASEDSSRSPGDGSPESAGASAHSSVRFAPSAIRMIATISGGLPRTVNLIADRALAIGCGQQTWTIDTAIVIAAGRELGLPVPPDRRIPSSLVGFAAAALVAATAWIGWWAITSTTRSGAPEGLSTGVAAPPADSSTARAPSTSSAPTADAAGPSTSGPAAAAETFSIVVASFRTSARAAAVAGEVASLGFPASTRATSGWQQVVVGPYSSRDEAAAAQERLKDANLAGTQIVSTAPGGGPPASPSPALLTEVAPPVPAPTVTPTESARPSTQAVSSPTIPVNREDDLLERARALAQLPDVKGIEHLRADLLKRTSFSDPRQDPAVVAVDRHLEEARRLQLTVDARDLRQYQVEEYRTALLGVIPDLDETTAALAAWSIGLGARPDSQATAALASRLRAFQPPREASAAHERLCLSLESIAATLAAPGAGDPASQTSRALAEMTQAKGTLQEFLRSSTTTRPRP